MVPDGFIYHPGKWNGMVRSSLPPSVCAKAGGKGGVWVYHVP